MPNTITSVSDLIAEGQSQDIQEQRDALEAQIQSLQGQLENAPPSQYTYYDQATGETTVLDHPATIYDQVSEGQLQSVVDVRSELQDQIDKLQNSDFMDNTKDTKELTQDAIEQFQIEYLDLVGDHTAWQINQAETLGNQLMQIASKTPEQIQQLQDIQQTNADLQQKYQGLLGDRLDFLNEIGASQEEIEKTRLTQAMAAQGHIGEYLKQPISEVEERYNDIALLQADRAEKALRGEGAISEGTLKRQRDEFTQLKENLARKGHAIMGDSPDTAIGFSTPAAQALGEFQQTWTLALDAERRGEINQGLSLLSQSTALSSDLQGRRLRNLNILANPQQPSTPGVTNAIGEGIGVLQHAGTQNANQGVGVLGGSVASATQPYIQSDLMEKKFEYDKQLAQMGYDYHSSMQPSGFDQLMSGVGTGVGLAGTKWLMSSRRYKKNIETLEIDPKTGLRIVSFVWKESGKKDTGMIAEETAKIRPDAVFKNDNGEIEGIMYDRLPQHITEKIDMYKDAEVINA